MSIQSRVKVPTVVSKYCQSGLLVAVSCLLNRNSGLRPHTEECRNQFHALESQTSNLCLEIPVQRI